MKTQLNIARCVCVYGIRLVELVAAMVIISVVVVVVVFTKLLTRNIWPTNRLVRTLVYKRGVVIREMVLGWYVDRRVV